MSGTTDKHILKNVRQAQKDLFFISFGILLYGVGYTAFILPEQVVMGGVSGISALLFYAFGFPPAISIWVLDAFDRFPCVDTSVYGAYHNRCHDNVCDYRCFAAFFFCQPHNNGG